MSNHNDTQNNVEATWNGELVDAYCHIGVPKYGSLSDVVRFFNRMGIQQGVLSLGPGIPDIDSILLAKQHFGQHIRIMGIPFGKNEEQRLELGELQISAGISGMRVMPDELLSNKQLLQRLGERGLWLYAINPFDSPDSQQPTARVLLEWLQAHPAGMIASPHFLRPSSIEKISDDPALFKDLLQHPRFHAIFSRFGGVNSARPYPHADLRQWVEELAELMSWRRILWGSEFPIIYQRSESPEQARDWLLQIGVSISDEEFSLYYGGNAKRLLFADPAPTGEDVRMPEWLEAQIDSSQTVYLFPKQQIYIPMRDHGTLLSHYMELTETEPNLRYADYIGRILSEKASQLRSEGELS